MFRNESDGPARLVIAMYPRIVDGTPAGPDTICTALTDDGGVQFLTLKFALPGYAVNDGNGYAFTVAGSDATLDVVVP